MSQKDISEKLLESYNDVFADIVNVLLFGGRRFIQPEELEDCGVRSSYKVDGKIREQERDVIKHWKNGNIRLACLGIENQTSPDGRMPVRVLSYDAAEYRGQLTRKEQVEIYPVVTLVLYFGYEKQWDKPLNLLDTVKVPTELQPYVNDYKINLFEIAYLPEETINLFQSDFRVVADYFSQKRKNDSYTGSRIEIKHVQETLHLLSVMTGDHRFEDALQNDDYSEGGMNTMCEVLDKLIGEGRREGMEAGIKTGRKQGMQAGMQLDNKLFAYLLQNGLTEEALEATKNKKYKKELLIKYHLASEEVCASL